MGGAAAVSGAWKGGRDNLPNCVGFPLLFAKEPCIMKNNHHLQDILMAHFGKAGRIDGVSFRLLWF